MLLTGSLPETVNIGGKEVPIVSDFRASVSFSILMYDPNLAEEEKILKGLEIYFPTREKDIYNIEEAVNQIEKYLHERIFTGLFALVQFFVAMNPEETVYSPGYLYTLPNGMPKYFVDFSGEEADDVVLHCWFRSGDPSFYSSAFVLHLDALKNSTLLYRGMNNVKFRSVVKPGDACVITARLVESKGNLYVCDAQLSVAGKRCCQGTLTIATVPAGD